MSTTSKKISRKVEKRMMKAVNQDSRTLPAQLMTIWFNHNKKLGLTKPDGTIEKFDYTKVDFVTYKGMEPHYVYNKKGEIAACKGYTPAEFNKAVCDELLERNQAGKVVNTYVYRNRVVTVELFEEDNDEGSKNYSLYEKDEAEKKAKGESGAKTISIYRKVMIDPFGWGSELIMDVLDQSQNITTHVNKAQKSREAWEAIEHVYIVKNVNGVNHVIEVEKPHLEF